VSRIYTQKTDTRHFALCPGFMNDGALWSRILPAFDNYTFTDQSQDVTLDGMVQRLLDTAPPQFMLMGFSLGGYVARHIALAAPERVTALVLANTSARPSDTKIIERNRKMISITELNGFQGLSRKARQKALHPEKRGDEGLLKEMQDMALHLGQTSFLNQLGLERPNGLLTLGEIKCPTLVIWSRQDELRSLQEAEELANGIPNAKLEIIENCGHMTPMEAPEKLIALLGKL
jgi:pimeloyl-ACP methyl ester carboxylesterase